MLESVPGMVGLAIVVAALVGPASAWQAKSSIRSVDFYNFSYEAGFDDETVTVANGTYERDEDDDKLFFKVLDVDFGDLTGDGREEAIVTTLTNTGGTGQFTEGLVFALRRDTPVVVTSVGGGDRADGGIHDLRVDEGRLVVERYGQERSGACCPEYVERTVYALRGDRLVAGASERIAYQVISEASRGPQRVRFLRGGSGAILAGSTNARESFLLGARKGQTLYLRFESKDAKATTTLSAPGGRIVGSLRAGERITTELPATGDYSLTVSSTTGRNSAEAYYVLEVEIR